MIRHLLLAAAVALLFASALALVSAQHRARSLFVDVERAQLQARNLEVDHDRSTIELARLSQPVLIERAAQRLGYQALDASRTVFLNLPQASVPANAPAPAAGGKQ